MRAAKLRQLGQKKKKQNKKQNGQFRLSNVSFLPSVNRPALVQCTSALNLSHLSHL
jgi:hypothetical protein